MGRPIWRRLTEVALTVGLATAVIGSARARRWMARWGSTELETTRPLPGDGLVAEPLADVTRSITIDAPVGAVWPWIAQMGSADLGRAGWYSYDRLDNAGVPSADRLRPQIPAPQEGDVLVPNPAFAWTVRDVDPGAHLVLELTSPSGWFTIHTTWTIAVGPAGENRTRLVERSRWDMRPRAVGVPFSLAFEVVDFVMMRKHLIGVRSRATAQPAAADAGPPRNRTLIASTDPATFDTLSASTIENSIEIQRPPETVFAYLTNLDREHEWNKQIRQVEALTDGPLRAGSRYRVRFGRGVGVSIIEYQDVDAPLSWTTTSTSRRLDVQFAGTITSVHGGSRVTMQTTLLPHGPLRLASPLLNRTMHESWNRHLSLVKSILEGATAQPA